MPKKRRKSKPPVHAWEHFGFRPELTCQVCSIDWDWQNEKEPRGECIPRWNVYF